MNRKICLAIILLILVSSNSYALPVVLPEIKQFGDKPLKKKFDIHTHNCKVGYSHHCVALASMYYSGIEVAQDYAKAIQLFDYACRHGNANGCYMLGRIYYQGAGVKKNAKDGLTMYSKSCRLGMKIACDEYRSILYGSEVSR